MRRISKRSPKASIEMVIFIDSLKKKVPKREVDKRCLREQDSASFMAAPLHLKKKMLTREQCFRRWALQRTAMPL